MDGEILKLRESFRRSMDYGQIASPAVKVAALISGPSDQAHFAPPDFKPGSAKQGDCLFSASYTEGISKIVFLFRSMVQTSADFSPSGRSYISHIVFQRMLTRSWSASEMNQPRRFLQPTITTCIARQDKAKTILSLSFHQFSSFISPPTPSQLRARLDSISKLSPPLPAPSQGDASLVFHRSFRVSDVEYVAKQVTTPDYYTHRPPPLERAPLSSLESCSDGRRVIYAEGEKSCRCTTNHVKHCIRQYLF